MLWIFVRIASFLGVKKKRKKSFLSFIILVPVGVLYSGKFFLTAESCRYNEVLLYSETPGISHAVIKSYCQAIYRNSFIRLPYLEDHLWTTPNNFGRKWSDSNLDLLITDPLLWK